MVHSEKSACGEKKRINYYPFGLQQKGYNDGISGNVNSTANKFKFNGIEQEEALGLNLYEMPLRQYDPAIARWTSIDPVIHYEYSTYTAFDNNPVFWADPSGANSTAQWMEENGITNDDLINVYTAEGAGPPSTHTDEDGNIISVKNDGDTGVYTHENGTTSADIDANHSSTNTSAGGTKVGETEYWDEFVSPETGKTFTGFKIEFGESFDQLISELNALSKDLDLVDIAMGSRGGGIFDIKKDFKNIGRLLNGKYATSRSAGNFLAGLNAEGGTYFGIGISFNTFQKLAGALHIEESNGNRLSKGQMISIVLTGSYSSSDKSKFKAPTWGEVNYQYRRSQEGWLFGENR